MRARYYKPELGRFTSRDSYAGNTYNPLTQNRYSYAHNNPVVNTDPSGHIVPIVGIVIMVGIGGVLAIDISYVVQGLDNVSKGKADPFGSAIDWGAVARAGTSCYHNWRVRRPLA